MRNLQEQAGGIEVVGGLGETLDAALNPLRAYQNILADMAASEVQLKAEDAWLTLRGMVEQLERHVARIAGAVEHGLGEIQVLGDHEHPSGARLEPMAEGGGQAPEEVAKPGLFDKAPVARMIAPLEAAFRMDDFSDLAVWTAVLDLAQTKVLQLSQQQSVEEGEPSATMH